MSSKRRPYVYCHTCGRQLATPGMSVRDMIVLTPEEVLEACEGNKSSPKLLRCQNPYCSSPRRAIIVPRNDEAKLFSSIRSWLPITTFRLRYEGAPDHPDNSLAVAEFAVDKVRRKPDICLHDLIDLDLLRCTLDGLGRKIRGPFTIFDIYCWGDIRNTNNWLLEPIEALDQTPSPVPPRFSPFCRWVRKRVHQLVIDSLKKQGACSTSCPFWLDNGQSNEVCYSRKPICTECVINNEGTEAATPENCFFYTSVLIELSPCYKCDRSQFRRFIDRVQSMGVKEAAQKWEAELLGAPIENSAKKRFRCWSGLPIEVMYPIIVHDHFIGGAMTGQIIPIPENATREEKQECLTSFREYATKEVMKVFGLSEVEAEDEMERLFDLREWETGSSGSLATPAEIKMKMQTLISDTKKITAVAQERYTAERRLQEEQFLEEVIGRFEIARHGSQDLTPDFLPTILTRMRELWGFEGVAYLNASPRTGGRLAILSDSKHVFAEEDRSKHVDPIIFQPAAPSLGVLLTSLGPSHYVEKPGCRWVFTADKALKILGWTSLRDLVAYATPTTLGQDLFLFYNRDPAKASFKPQEKGPSTLCLESIRRVCSGLSNRMADWAYMRQQVLFLQVLGHTTKTPVETAKIALKNLIADAKIPLEGSAKNLHAAIREIGERTYLAMEVVKAFQDLKAPQPCELDLLEEIRRCARQNHQRYNIEWELRAEETTNWHIMMAKQSLQLLMSNALANAFKYSYKNHKVEIFVSREYFKDSNDPGDTVVQVRNWGDGVLKDELPRLGTLHFRGNTALNKPGSGLGLFLIDWIIKKEGKTWKFESEPSGRYVDSDKGNSFKNTLTFQLPRRLR